MGILAQVSTRWGRGSSEAAHIVSPRSVSVCLSSTTMGTEKETRADGQQFDLKLHAHCLKAGFTFKGGRYFATGEPVWEKERRIEQGRKQYAVPASSVAQFLEDEVKQVDNRIKRMRERAGVDAKMQGDDGVEDIDLAEVPKEKKAKTEAKEDEASKEKEEKKEAKEEAEAEEESPKE